MDIDTSSIGKGQWEVIGKLMKLFTGQLSGLSDRKTEESEAMIIDDDIMTLYIYKEDDMYMLYLTIKVFT